MANNDNGDKEILRIPIDTSGFDEAIKKIEELKKQFGEVSEESGKQSKGWGKGWSWGKSKPGNTPESDSFRSIRKAATDPRMTGNDSFIGKFGRSSDDARKSWVSIEKSIGKVFKDLTGISRTSIGIGSRWSKVGGLLGPIGVAAGALVGGTVAAAGDLAGKNREARELGLPVGAANLFDTEAQQYGFDKSDLQRINAFRLNPANLGAFAALGINSQQAQNEKADQLTFDVMRAAQAKRQELGNSYALWAQSTHADQLVSLNQANALASYSAGDINRTQQQYNTKLPDFAASAKAADEATDAWRKLSTDFQQNLIKLDAAFSPLMPKIAELADGFTNAVVAFSKSPELKADLEGLENAFTQLEKPVAWIADKLSPLANTQSQLGGVLIDAYNDVKNGDWSKVLGDLNKPITGDTPSWVPYAQKNWLSKTPFGQTILGMTPGKAAQPASNNPSFTNPNSWVNGVLTPMAKIESNNNPNAVSSKGALGLFQLMPDTARELGVNPFDPAQAKAGAQRMLTRLYKKYHGDAAKTLAAYNWGEGNLDKDIKANGDDWFKHMNRETTDYLYKFENAGVNVFGNDRMARAYVQAQHLEHLVSNVTDRVANAFREGGGSKFRLPPAEVKVKSELTVYNQAGSNIGVTVGGIPQ